MKEKLASALVQIALDQLNAATLAQQKEIARLGREQEKLGEEWLLDPMRGVWVLPDAAGQNPNPGGKDVQAADAAGSVRTDS